MVDHNRPSPAPLLHGIRDKIGLSCEIVINAEWSEVEVR